jgi:hypothetical protein
MLLIAESMPATSEMVPLIEIYLTIVMALTSLSIVLTVYVLQLHHSGPVVIPIPHSFKYSLVRYIAPLIGMKKVVEIYAQEHNLIETDDVYRCFAKQQATPMDSPLIKNKKNIVQEKKNNKNQQGIYLNFFNVFQLQYQSSLFRLTSSFIDLLCISIYFVYLDKNLFFLFLITDASNNRGSFRR